MRVDGRRKGVTEKNLAGKETEVRQHKDTQVIKFTIVSDFAFLFPTQHAHLVSAVPNSGQLLSPLLGFTSGWHTQENCRGTNTS